MSIRLTRNQARMCLERGRDELSPRRHDALARLIDQLDESLEVGFDVVLDELAGIDDDESTRMRRLRRIRKEIVYAFQEIRLNFYLEVSSSKQLPAERHAWFVGDDLLAHSLNERTEQIIGGSDAVNGTRNHEPINSISAESAPIVITYISDDDELEANEFVNEIRTTLKAENRGDLAESLWFRPDRTENRSSTEELRMLDQARLVVVLWSTKLQGDPWFRENVCPRITPDKFEIHHNDCLGVIFGICTLTDDEINARIGFGIGRQGSFNWQRAEPGRDNVELSPSARRNFAQTIARDIAKRLETNTLSKVLSGDKLRRRVRLSLEEPTGTQLRYSPLNYEEPLARSADISREGHHSPSSDQWWRPGSLSSDSYPLLRSLIYWALDPTAPSVHAVLGDFGCGKTFTARMLAKAFLEDHLERPTLYIDLREVSLEDIVRRPILDTVLEGWLNNWRQGLNGAELTLDELKHEINKGALVIFDGFDEVSVHLENSIDHSFLNELMRVVSSVSGEWDGSRTKMLVTCRSHYFQTQSQQNSMLVDEARGDLSSGDGSNNIGITSSVVLPFSPVQIRSALSRRRENTDVDSSLALMASTHDFENLAERTNLLTLIHDQRNTLKQETAAGRRVNSVSLYRQFCNDSLQRDSRQHWLAPKDKLELMARLAAHLCKQSAQSLPLDQLKQWLYSELESRADWRSLYLAQKPGLALKDLHTATFIVRSDDGIFCFAQTSLFHYFVAEYLNQALESNHRSSWFGLSVSIEAVRYLVQAIDLSTDSEGLWRRLAKWARAPFDDCASLIQLRIAQITVERGDLVTWPQMDFRGADLSDWTLGVGDPNAMEPASNPLLRLDGANFRGANLRRSIWNGVSLRESSFDDAEAAQVKFLGCRVGGSCWDQGHFDAAVFRGCDLSRQDANKVSSLHRAHVLKGPTMARVSGSHPRIEWNSFGHSDRITYCAFSPDGHQVLTESEDLTVRLWDAASGEELRRFEGYANQVTFCAISPDGHQVLTGSEDSTVRLWDTASDEELSRFEGHVGLVLSCAFSPDGHQVLTGSDDLTVRLWDAASGEELRRFEGHTHQVTFCAFSPDGHQVLTGSEDLTVRLWDAASGEELRRFEEHTRKVNSCTFSPDGHQVLTSSDDYTARLWDAASGKELRRLEGYANKATCCAFSPDGHQVLTGSDDYTVRLWDAASGEELRRFEGHTREVLSCAFSPDGHQVLTGSEDYTVRLWDANSGEEVRRFEGYANQVTCCAFSPDGHQVLTGSEDLAVRLWDAASGEQLRRFQGHVGLVLSCAFSPDGHQVLTGSEDLTVRLWDAASGEELRRFEGHTREVNSCTFSPDGHQVLTGSYDYTARLWDAASGKELRRFQWPFERRITIYGPEHPGNLVTSCAFSPDGHHVLTGSDDYTVRLWDAASGEELRRFEGHTLQVTSCTFSPDGRQVLSGSDDHTVRLWDATSGEELRRFVGHTHHVTCCAFSPDGCQVLTGSDDHTVRLWDAASGEELRRFEGHTHQVTSCAFSPDGHQVLTGSQDRRARIFDLHENVDQLPKLVLWHLPDGWAVTTNLSDVRPLVGGSGWYYLRAYCRDANGRPTQMMLEEVYDE